MMYLYLTVACLIALLVVVLYLQNQSRKESFESPSPTQEYSSCRDNGFSKEYCLTRFNPGVGLGSSGWMGRAIKGSRGEIAVF